MFFFSLFTIFILSKDDEAVSTIPLVYYSLVKLQHASSKLFLSSIEINYLTGSTQQIVRGVNSTKIALAETLWALLPVDENTGINSKEIRQGEPVRCGDYIKLKHSVTSKNLHSHAIPAQLGKGYEVSCFDGTDTGDVWEVQCKENVEILKVRDHFTLKHKDTGYYLNANATGTYISEIMGEHEIYCSETNDDAEFFVRHGIFVS